MKPKPAVLLLFLVLGSAVFLAFLLKMGGNDTQRCQKDQEPVQKTDGMPVGSFNHLIAFTRK